MNVYKTNNMYKRPPLRVNHTPIKNYETIRPKPGSFLDKIINPPPTVHYKQIKMPVYQKNAYIDLLKKNYAENNIEWKGLDIPDYTPPPITEQQKEPELPYIDWVYIKPRVLKSGIIRIKLCTSFASLYEKYYSKCEYPPIKSLINACKTMGFSEKFVERMKNNHETRIIHGKKISKAIDAIFNKEPAKKTKKKKEEEPKPEPEPEEENNDEEEQDQEDDGPEEDEALDVEVDEDVEEQQEEEYFSDGGD
jgi:hypothetical protein